MAERTRPPLGPTGQKLDQMTQTSQRVFDRLRGMPMGEIEGLGGEPARPLAMDVMKIVTLGTQLLEQWGYAPELPDNVVPESELEARRARKQFRPVK